MKARQKDVVLYCLVHCSSCPVFWMLSLHSLFLWVCLLVPVDSLCGCVKVVVPQKNFVQDPLLRSSGGPFLWKYADLPQPQKILRLLRQYGTNSEDAARLIRDDITNNSNDELDM